MLQQQINYMNLVETRRHNLVDEAKNWANTMLEYLKLEETRRHNLTTEQIELKKLAENIRHNVASEDLQQQTNGINLYLANTKAGELALKEVVEPLKAEASMTTANAKAYEASFAGIKASAAALTAEANKMNAESKRLDSVNSVANTANTTENKRQELNIDKEYKDRYTQYLDRSNDLRAKELTERSVSDFLNYRNQRRNSNANLLKALPSVTPD